jgi:chromosome segregation ATPase
MDEGQTGTPAQPTQPADAPQDQSYEARYNGLNRTYQEHRQKWDGEKTQLNGVIADLTGKSKDWETKFAEVDKARATLAEQIEALNKAKTDADSKAATLEKRLSRQDLFMSKHPNLAGYEKEGLLRTDLEGADLDAYLDKMEAKLGAVQKAALDEVMEGATPNAAPGTREDGKLDMETLGKQIDEALDKGDMATYEALLPKWIELSDNVKR